MPKILGFQERILVLALEIDGGLIAVCMSEGHTEVLLDAIELVAFNSTSTIVHPWTSHSRQSEGTWRR